eukprot:5000159-Pleurochrysis_carterae.AAC.1
MECRGCVSLPTRRRPMLMLVPPAQRRARADAPRTGPHAARAHADAHKAALLLSCPHHRRARHIHRPFSGISSD